MFYSAGQVDVPNAVVVRAWRMQFVWLGLSLIALLVVTRVQLRWLEWFAPIAYLAGVAALVVTLFVGTGAGTAAPVPGPVTVIRTVPAMA